MVALTKTYDDSQPSMSDGGFPLQIGEHSFMIVSEEVKDTAANNGNKYLQYNCVVDAGAQQGVDFAIRLNFWNSNPQAVEIAEKEFNSLRMAAGVPATNDSAHLLNKRAIAVVAAKTKGKNAGEIYIKEYKPASGSVSAPATSGHAVPPAPDATPPAAPSGGGAPWHNK